jgi:acyl-coenzyme A synthetase/AMP-(fatty) acid ligase
MMAQYQTSKRLGTSLRTIGSGGAAINNDVWSLIARCWPHAELATAFGIVVG